MDDHSLGVANDLERFRLDLHKFKTCNQTVLQYEKLLLLLWYMVIGFNQVTGTRDETVFLNRSVSK